MRKSARSLSERLDALYHDYNQPESATDPIQLVRPFPDPADREIAGFCAAALAFGRVSSVINSISTLFARFWPRFETTIVKVAVSEAFTVVPSGVF